MNPHEIESTLNNIREKITDKQFKYMYVLLIKYIEAEKGFYDKESGVGGQLSILTNELFGFYTSDIRSLTRKEFDQLVVYLQRETMEKSLARKEAKNELIKSILR